jgi:hypothetical protein
LEIGLVVCINIGNGSPKLVTYTLDMSLYRGNALVYKEVKREREGESQGKVRKKEEYHVDFWSFHLPCVVDKALFGALGWLKSSCHLYIIIEVGRNNR